MKKSKVSNRGAPKKQAKDKIDTNGLTPELNKQLAEIARDRNVPIAKIKREAIEWYIDALEQGKRLPIVNSQLETAEEEISREA